MPFREGRWVWIYHSGAPPSVVCTSKADTNGKADPKGHSFCPIGPLQPITYGASDHKKSRERGGNAGQVRRGPGCHLSALGHRSRSAENWWGGCLPAPGRSSSPGGYEESQDLPILVLTDDLPVSGGGKKKKEPTPQASCAPSPRASVSASVKWGGAALPGRGRGAAALPERRGSYGFPFTPRVGGGSRAWRGASSFPGAGAAAAQRRCSQKRRSRGASAELGTLRPAADPAPSAHFYICAPFQSSVTCPALRPIGGALWSGQWKGLGQSTRRLPWR